MKAFLRTKSSQNDVVTVLEVRNVAAVENCFLVYNYIFLVICKICRAMSNNPRYLSVSPTNQRNPFIHLSEESNYVS